MQVRATQQRVQAGVLAVTLGVALQSQDPVSDIAIVLDTSTSMQQRCGDGTSLLDVARLAAMRFVRPILSGRDSSRNSCVVVSMDLQSKWCGSMAE
jgi:hypothetical protein